MTRRGEVAAAAEASSWRTTGASSVISAVLAKTPRRERSRRQVGDGFILLPRCNGLGELGGSNDGPQNRRNIAAGVLDDVANGDDEMLVVGGERSPERPLERHLCEAPLYLRMSCEVLGKLA